MEHFPKLKVALAISGNRFNLMCVDSSRMQSVHRHERLTFYDGRGAILVSFSVNFSDRPLSVFLNTCRFLHVIKLGIFENRHNHWLRGLDILVMSEMLLDSSFGSHL